MPKYKLVAEDGSELELIAENLPKEIKDSIIQSAQGLVYSNIDAKIQEVFGVKKNQDEKTSDFISRVIKEKDDQITQLKAGSPEISKLQEDIVKLQGLNDNLTKKITEKETEFSEKLNTEYVRSQVAGLQISVPAHLSEKEEIEAFKADASELLLSKFNQKYYVQPDAQGNRVVFDKSTKEPVADENLRRLSLSQIFQKDNPYLFKEVKAAGAGGAGGSGSGKPTDEGKGFKTFEDVSAAAVKAGHSVGSPEYSKFVSEKAEASGIEI